MGPVCHKNHQKDNILDDHRKYYFESHDLLESKISTRFSIVIKNVSNQLDSGIYNCSIKNLFGESIFSFRILTKSNEFIYL